MGRTVYSVELCSELRRVAEEAELEIRPRPLRYDSGDVIETDFTTVWPETGGHARFRIEKFVGGGFAGQVYRGVLERVWQDEDTPRELRQGGVYALKIMLPPSRFSRRFRDFIYRLGFQAPFSAQVNRAACRAGLLWQKFALKGAGVEFGRPDAVADVYASFYDPLLKSYGEIREWVEGRTWHLEADTDFRARRRWKDVDPRRTGSPEYVAKRQFMHRFVKMLREAGAAELARQYEWWTMKSQPNVLKRSGNDADPQAGLCAVDFRAGLALLPFLPLSPADVPLILAGLVRGSLVQFDRFNPRALRAFAERRSDRCPDLPAMADAIISYDREYRRSMPDLTHQGWRLPVSRELRADVRRGLTEGYAARDMVDADFSRRLASRGGRFAVFYMLGAVPILGSLVRKLWGNRIYRRHVGSVLTNSSYFRAAARAGVAARLVRWHRSGRTDELRTARLLRHPALFWTERLTLGWLPAILHRAATDPSYVAGKIRRAFNFMRLFYRDADFRERWLSDQVEEAYTEGMLREREREEILAHVRDPFIVKYLKCLAVHFATLPVTQIVSVLVGSVAAVWTVVSGGTWGSAGARFGLILIFFQIIPISPGSICRGLYVVYLMIRERNFRDYMVAAPLSFAKYIGYLAFPIQMVTSYPALSRFMASRWATDAVHIVPVFGEKGALFEHMIFDLFFNVPRKFGQWAGRHIRGILDLWLLIGTALATYVFFFRRVDWTLMSGIKTGVQVLIAYAAVFLLPRVLFYPLLKKRNKPGKAG